MPINPVSGPPVSNVTPSTPAQPITPTAPVAPPTPAAPGQPSRFDAGVARLRGKALELALNEAASEHDLAKSLSFGLAQGNVTVAERIALPGSKAFTELVANDSRRAAHARASGETWVATRAMVGASAGAPLGAGASLGFSGSVEVTSVVAHDVKGAGDVTAALEAQARSMVLPLDAEALASMKLPPGSEWMVRGQAGANLGVGIGRTVSYGADPLTASASVGVNVGASTSDVFTKQVKVLDGTRVFVQVARQDRDAVSGSVGLDAGIDLTGGGALGHQAAQEVEKRARIAASLAGSASRGEKVMGAAVLDLSTPAGREAYDYILRSGPNDAADFIETQNLGVKYAETSRTSSTGLNAQLGSAVLLATSTVRGTTHGVLEEAGSTTLLSQADYGRNVGGFFARLAVGEERSVNVRAGSVQRDGATQQAMAVTLAVKDPKLTGEELQQLQRFGDAMGAPLQGLPALRADFGKGEYAVCIALTGEDVAQLRSRSVDDLKLAFATAHRDIAGGVMPPWFDQEAQFDWYKGRLRDAQLNAGGDPNARRNAIADYKQAYGRDLERDVDSERAIDAIARQVSEAKGKPIGDWGKVLEALGKQPSADVRAATLALRRVASADVVSLSVNVGGKASVAQPQVAAPPTIADITGPLLSAPA
jgi:hypothetical protein